MKGGEGGAAVVGPVPVAHWKATIVPRFEIVDEMYKEATAVGVLNVACLGSRPGRVPSIGRYEARHPIV